MQKPISAAAFCGFRALMLSSGGPAADVSLPLVRHCFAWLNRNDSAELWIRALVGGAAQAARERQERFQVLVVVAELQADEVVALGVEEDVVDAA